MVRAFSEMAIPAFLPNTAKKNRSVFPSKRSSLNSNENKSAVK